jgi:uncharacterized protein (TIGR01777 family)
MRKVYYDYMNEMRKPLFSLLFNKVSMQVFITGATGLIGKRLTKKLVEQSHVVTILTRDMDKARRIFGNDINYCHSLSQFKSFNYMDAVINLAGEPIADKRWTAHQKERLCQSRWTITQQLAELIKKSRVPPKTFISGSAIGYYGSQRDNTIIEESSPHKEFTHYLCKRWEELALQAESPQTRVCLLRTGIVMAKNGGALAKMLPPFRLGVGGVMGSGQQYMSWIHIDDMVDAIYFLLTSSQLSGVFNMCAPNPVNNASFSHTLADQLNRPCFVTVPACGLKTVLGEVSTVVLDGQRAVPRKLLEAGYHFSYDRLEPALKNILRPDPESTDRCHPRT